MHRLKQKLLTGSLALCFALSSIVSPSIVAAVSDSQSTPTTSIYGFDQYETAAKIAQNGWTATSDYAILAAGMPTNLIDALAAGPLAARLTAPILLTEGNGLNKHAKQELTRLKVKKVYITSGSAVIKQSVIDEVKTIASVTEVKTLGGYDASHTSVNIAKEMENLGVKVSKVVVTGGAGSDALSIAPIAGAQGMPILYTNRDSLSNHVFSYLEGIKANLTKTYVIGGTGVISDTAQAQLQGSVTRYYGQTLYDTNLEVLKQFAGALKNKSTYVANGDTLVDALAGVPLAVQNNSPILLTGKTMPATSIKYAQSNLSPNVIGLGGESVVPSKVLTQLGPSEIISLDGSSKGSADATNLEQFNGIIKLTGNNVTLKNAKTEYSIYVQGDNATLTNLTVQGTIFLDPGDNGSATLQNVNATNIVILSGAEHSINLMDVIAALLSVQSNSPNVHVNASGATRFEQTQASTSAIFEAADGSFFGTIRITYSSQEPGAVPVVELIGAFPDTIEVGGGVTVIAAPGSNISNLDITTDNPNQSVTLQGNFNSVAVNSQANVTLGENTTITDVVANARANIVVPPSSTIRNFDAGSTGTTPSGGGSVGSTPITTGGGGGSSSSNKNNDNNSRETVLVSGIIVTGAGNLTTVINAGTLQMSAAVIPANATNSSVTWSVVNGAGTATINSTGLLTATGLGTLTVKATAQDGSGIVGERVITVEAAAAPVAVPTITSLTTTKDAVTITFSENIVAIDQPNTITFAAGTYDFDVYQDMGSVTLFRLGHYGLLEQTANSMKLAILGDWGDLSLSNYDFKLYTGDPFTPTVIAQSEDFSFQTWNDADSQLQVIIHDPAEIWLAVAPINGGDVSPPLLGLVKAEFKLFDGAGTQVDFNFQTGSEYDPFIPDSEYRLSPISGVFEGIYHIKFVKAGYNPKNARVEVTVPVPVNATAYNEIVTSLPADNNLGTYTAESWTEFSTAIAECDLNLTAADGQTALDTEVIAIQAALNLLVEAV